MTLPTPIATAADYADALLTARKFKTLLFWLLLLMLLTQLAVFLLAKYTPHILPDTTTAATQPTELTTGNSQLATAPSRPLLSLALEYLTGLIDFAGIACSVVYSLTLLLMLLILIQGRLVGVSQLTRAFLTSLVLCALLFPWQAFLNFPDLAGASFRLPGTLYTWPELVADARSFDHLSLPAAILKWARFLGFPLLALFLLLSTQSHSRRSLKRALGEIDYTTPSATAPPPTA